MILNEEYIINLVESYRNQHRYSQEKMAELCGMSSKSVYNSWINGKRKGKISYLLAFMNNTNIVFSNKNEYVYGNDNEANQLNDPKSPRFNEPKPCTNPECVETIKQLTDRNQELLEKYELSEENRTLLKEKIEKMERERRIHNGKSDGGDMEEPNTSRNAG